MWLGVNTLFILTEEKVASYDHLHLKILSLSSQSLSPLAHYLLADISVLVISKLFVAFSGNVGAVADNVDIVVIASDGIVVVVTDIVFGFAAGAGVTVFNSFAVTAFPVISETSSSCLTENKTFYV